VTPPLPHAVAFYQNLAGLQRDGLNSPWQMVTLLVRAPPPLPRSAAP